MLIIKSSYDLLCVFATRVELCGLLKKDVAEALGVDDDYIYDLLRAKYADFSAEIAFGMIYTLGLAAYIDGNKITTYDEFLSFVDAFRVGRGGRKSIERQSLYRWSARKLVPRIGSVISLLAGFGVEFIVGNDNADN